MYIRTKDETWRTLDENQNYEVSNFGRVRNKRNDYILKPILKTNGYSCVSIKIDFEKYKCFSIHRLVAKYFIPNPLNKPNVNHKDFDRSNNCVDNLEWVTQSENNYWSSENISKSHKGRKMTSITREKMSKGKINDFRLYPPYIYKVRNAYRFLLRGKDGKKLVDKTLKTLEETIAFKEKWLEEHRKEFNTRWNEIK